eukprot:TRINITY_DN6316_c0_g1_i1.p1 TRINITY_DN6316_c0_g1~~TRINITY_DN6316_c0_g1_i1.p1  ORF type:complete len:362 (+),score=136.52 TRINITY_DN6316_c0_g1_i1:235-1320(+)
MSAVARSRVYLDITIGAQPAQRVVLQLYDDVVPKTVENFKTLAAAPEGSKLTYKGCGFHRVIKNFMIQGGDFTRGDGTGGVSIYGEKFEDEKPGLDLRFDRPGLLAMANAGPNTNGSQFFITTTETEHLNGKHVIFGEVINGMDVVREIEMSETTPNDKPVYDVKIANSGVLAEGEPDGVVVDVSDPYPTFPADLRKNGGDIEGAVPTVAELLKIADAIRERGNEGYKQKDVTLAVRKYQKALRYLKFEDYPSGDERKTLEEAKVKVMGNLAACYLALKDYSETIRVCQDILAIDENNAKALSRRGQAYLNMKDYEESIRDFKKVLSITPEDAAVNVSEICCFADVDVLLLILQNLLFCSC